MPDPSNDLFDFIIAETLALGNEYERVQRRVKEDPGTAGDQGEENWATIFRKWLPAEYTVVTKGRIISHKGVASPQVDVIILHPGYPPCLRDKKLYLAGGVAAAFECKLTVDAGHITDAINNCVKIKRLTAPRTGTPYMELNSPLLYGLLAHSHSWQGERATPIDNITKQAKEKEAATAQHPREVLDLLCVADLATWAVLKTAYLPKGFPHYGEKCLTTLMPSVPRPERQKLSPMAVLLLKLYQKIAWEDSRMRRLADYFSLTLNDHLGSSEGMPRVWELKDVYTEKVREWLETRWGQTPVPENVYGKSGGLWDEWRLTDTLSSVE